ncbi:hypothetical protein Pelo_6040 [Pelomyxa schiedti]|nr:hypothetical protein Pelo_6040 [Pelomyxa schiedti]
MVMRYGKAYHTEGRDAAAEKLHKFSLTALNPTPRTRKTATRVACGARGAAIAGSRRVGSRPVRCVGRVHLFHSVEKES